MFRTVAIEVNALEHIKFPETIYFYQSKVNRYPHFSNLYSSFLPFYVSDRFMADIERAFFRFFFSQFLSVNILHFMTSMAIIFSHHFFPVGKSDPVYGSGLP